MHSQGKKGVVSPRLRRRSKKRKVTKIETCEDERRRSNKSQNGTFVDTQWIQMGEKRHETATKKKKMKRRKEKCSRIDFKYEEMYKIKKKTLRFSIQIRSVFLLLVCTHYDLSQFIVLSMKYCNKNTVNYS